MASLDVEALAKNLLVAGNTAMKGDISQMKGFTQEQLGSIARQAAAFAAGVADGSIPPAMYGTMQDSMKEAVWNFLNTLAGLAATIAEEVWNAMVGALWGEINAVTGLALKL